MRPLEKLKIEVASAIAGLSAAQFAGRREGKWSISEILEHLYLTYTGTIKGFERVTAAGQPQVTRPNLKQRASSLLVLGLGYMPSGREAPRMARPRGIPAEKVASEIVAKIGEMEAAIAGCEQKLGPGKLLDHPILGPLDGNGWRKFHLVHGRHHIKQIRKHLRL